MNEENGAGFFHIGVICGIIAAAIIIRIVTGYSLLSMWLELMKLYLLGNPAAIG